MNATARSSTERCLVCAKRAKLLVFITDDCSNKNFVDIFVAWQVNFFISLFVQKCFRLDVRSFANVMNFLGKMLSVLWAGRCSGAI